MPGGLQGYPGDVNIQGNLFVQGSAVINGGVAPSFPLLAPDGSIPAPSYAFTNSPSTGFFQNGNQLVITAAGVGVALFSATPELKVANLLGFSTAWNIASDVFMKRNAVGVLEINNGTAGVFRDLIARNASIQASGGGNPSATTTQLVLNVAGNNPQLIHIDSSRTINNKIHDIQFSGGQLTAAFINDVFGISTNWLTVTGGQAAGITSILFGGTSASLLGFYGSAGAAQSTGYGTPTGGAKLINFPGATATLAQTSGALAQLLLDLKAIGLLGA
jgi:hypothetical protein